MKKRGIASPAGITTSMASIYPYPPMPAECVDTSKTPLLGAVHSSPRELSLVTSQTPSGRTRTHSDEWGTPEKAAARALQEAAVSLGTERLLRTHHRSLTLCPFVYEATEPDGKTIWIVSIGPTVPMYDTHAGGREIHIHPEYLLPQLSQVYTGSRKDPLARRINPRRFLPPSDLDLLRRFFPSAIGARVLISGFIIMLFRNRKAIEASWLEGCVQTFGLLRLGYDVAVHYPTDSLADSGNAVADSPEKSECATPLGLKLRFSDGSNGIAVPTHAFIDMKKPQDQLSRTHKSALSKTKTILAKATTKRLKGYVKMRHVENSPLGKSVWFVQDPKKKVGNVTTTFDHHVAKSSTFPDTISHDISIVTGDHLPAVTNPPRAPNIVGWGNYCDALDGKFAFAMALNARTQVSTRETRRDEFGTLQKAIVEGTEYLWDRKAHSQSVALLWRAMHDGTDMEGLSGSVLCLGRPTDAHCRAVVFKHFETPICPQHFDSSDPESAHGDIAWSSIKGGFLPPPELRDAEIICETEGSTAIPSGDQTWDIEWA